MKRIPPWIPILLCTGALTGILALPGTSAGVPANAPSITATAAVLMDARTGQVLYSRAPHLRWPPASTTKILTAILVREHLPLEKEVSISARASAQRTGSAIGLEVGERWTVRDLLYALLLVSANDAAVALAEATSGSVEAFARLMNEKAAAIGAKESNFVVPHGLYHPAHSSTAYDLALLARYALRDPILAKIFRTRSWVLNRPGAPPRNLENRNRLLQIFPGADGVKTGWIAQSGQNLVASATRDGWQLIAVVLNASDLYGDAIKLLDYGFQHFALVRLATKGQVVGSKPVEGSTLEAIAPEDIEVVLPKGEEAKLRISFREDLSLPIATGTEVGVATSLVGGKAVATTPLVAKADVVGPNLILRLWRWFRKLFS